MGYSAPQNEVSVLTTEMNALANSDLCNGSTEFDNSTNKDAWGMAELDFGASLDLSAANNNPVCYLYLIPSYDGINYADDGEATNELVPSEYLKGTFEFNKESARRAVLDKFDIAPGKYKACIFNDLGAAFPASGATVKIKSFDRA